MPIGWVPYTQEQSYYLEINSDINYDSVKQGLRASYVQFWTTTYHNLPTVTTTFLD